VSFSGDVAKFRKDAVQKLDKQIRGVTLGLFRDVILATPVGNPELWERNRVAANYNQQVSVFNSGLRDNPDNLDKRGRLKRGRKLNDGMDIQKPKGYVGGRLRNSWYVTMDKPSDGSGREPNKAGAGSLTELKNIGVGGVCFLTNNLPYALPVEYGHSKQAPAGMVRINVTRVAEMKVIKV
jgi:hypothetical protein